MKIIISLLFAFSTLIIINCSTNETQKMNVYLLHDIWALEFVQGEQIIIDETFKNLPMLEIYVEEERVHGNTSCNTINGKVNIDGNKISFLEIITTEMACPGNLEQRFLSALKKVNSYKIEKMRLYLFYDEEEFLVLKKID
jgi:heat shock protein HslJ